jgi:hypothetical protein
MLSSAPLDRGTTSQRRFAILDAALLAGPTVYSSGAFLCGWRALSTGQPPVPAPTPRPFGKQVKNGQRTAAKATGKTRCCPCCLYPGCPYLSAPFRARRRLAPHPAVGALYSLTIGRDALILEASPSSTRGAPLPRRWSVHPSGPLDQRRFLCVDRCILRRSGISHPDPDAAEGPNPLSGVFLCLVGML